MADLSALTLDDAAGLAVALHDGSARGVTEVTGLVGITAPRRSVRPRPTAHGTIDETRWTDEAIITVDAYVRAATNLDAFTEFRLVTAPMLATLEAPALLKWTEGAERTPLGTNLITNPSFEVDTAGWGTAGGFLLAGGTLARSTAEATSGVASLQIVTTAVNQGAFFPFPATLAVGTYRVLLRAKSSVAEPFRARLVGAGANTALQDVTLTPGIWASYDFTLVTTAPAPNAQLYVQSLGPTAERTIYVDAVIVGVGISSYFDGASTNAEWSGTPHASTSTLYDTNTIVFNGTTSSDDGQIINYLWNFGDGTTGFGSVITHVYPSSGVYTPVLTVTDDTGLQSILSNAISV